MIQRRSLKLMVALGAPAVLLLWPALRVHAFNPQPDPPAFGMIGIDPFGTARMNVVCAEGPLPGGIPPGPCDVTMQLRDVSGHVLKQMMVTLQPGQGAFLDQRGMDLPTTSMRHTLLQPFIPQAGRGFILATVEVFDNLTGRTTAVLNPTQPKSLGMVTTGGM